MGFKEQVIETEPIARAWGKRLLRGVPIVGLVTVLSATALEVPMFDNDDIRYDAESVEVGLLSLDKVPLHDVLEVSWGSATAEDGSYAASFGEYSNHLIYEPSGDIRMTAVIDDEIGFHVLIDEVKDGVSIPIDYANNVKIETDKALPCTIEISDNTLNQDDSCFSNLYRGVTHVDVELQDGFSGSEKELASTALRMQELIQNNNWCEFQVVGVEEFGGPVVYVDAEGRRNASGDGPVVISGADRVSGQSIYRGVKELTNTSLRIMAAEYLNLPLTDKNGRDIFVIDGEADSLRNAGTKAGIDVIDMTPAVYQTTIASVLEEEKVLTVQQSIEQGPTIAEQTYDFSRSNPYVPTPIDSNGVDLTAETFEAYGPNFWCIQDDNESIVESARIHGLRTQLGRLGGLQPYAVAEKLTEPANELNPHLQYEITSLDETDAIEKIENFLTTIEFIGDGDRSPQDFELPPINRGTES